MGGCPLCACPYSAVSEVEKCLLLPRLLSPRSGGISPTLGETPVPSGSPGVTAALLWGSEQPPAPDKQHGAGPTGTPAGWGQIKVFSSATSPTQRPAVVTRGWATAVPGLPALRFCPQE